MIFCYLSNDATSWQTVHRKDLGPLDGIEVFHLSQPFKYENLIYDISPESKKI